mmetsp:Transcript_43713/g.107571  ORF Transcript_43713/g.107571 Transcript_43713/m.107571 type:complete len:543 (+) Transcript_43713:69-1697(+)
MQLGLALPTVCLGSAVLLGPDHVPVRSSGCGKASPYPPGQSTVATGTYAGVERIWRVYVPKSYDSNTPLPVIFDHPGWGDSAKSETAGAGLELHADERGYIAVTPQGMDDNTSPWGPWYSWNTVGSTQSPGPAGPTCTQNFPEYCYTSCQKCTDSPQCDWTTCDEDITPTGTGTADVGGFLPGLWDTLEQQLCVDATREYATGCSNGGMMAYQSAVDMPERLAAIAPVCGSFHAGFAMAPKIGVPLMDIHGTSDTTVPANVSLSGDGYYYTPTEEIFFGNKYSPGWAQANQCSGGGRVYPTSYDGQKQLWCLAEGDCAKGDLVRCSWKGGHNWYGNKAELNGGLTSEFLLKWTKPTHLGNGSTSERARVARPLGSVRVGVAALERRADFPYATLTAGGHYGDPDTGCQPDEDSIDAGTGRVCAPRINASDANAKPPTPACLVGGVGPSKNGCPTSAANLPAGSKSWPICIAKGNVTDTDPYNDADFHCLLVCPCLGEGDDCGEEAHAQCPGLSRCERGELRNRAQGVCTYHGTGSQAQAVVV